MIYEVHWIRKNNQDFGEGGCYPGEIPGYFSYRNIREKLEDFDRYGDKYTIRGEV